MKTFFDSKNLISSAVVATFFIAGRTLWGNCQSSRMLWFIQDFQFGGIKCLNWQPFLKQKWLKTWNIYEYMSKTSKYQNHILNVGLPGVPLQQMYVLSINIWHWTSFPAIIIIIIIILCTKSTQRKQRT